jgi:protein O-GlcNAc transferase
MKKVISFSLWGNNNTYTIGAIKNAELAKKFYPDFECWFYIHKDSVPLNIIKTLKSLSNTKIILREGDINLLRPMLWRFETIDNPNVEINLSRDTDTRILLREKLAVDEWILSGKTFHIMRDHPCHMDKRYRIMGGMFGTRKIKNFPKWSKIINTLDLKKYKSLRCMDQDFLDKYIYPLIINDCLIHSSFGKFVNENNVKKFPIEYCEKYYYVGGYIYADETDNKRVTDILKKSLLNN